MDSDRTIRTRLTRRAALAGALAGVSSAALGKAPVSSPFPRTRPAGAAGAGFTDAPASLRTSAAAADGLVAEAKLGGQVCYLVADMKTGLVLEGRDADRGMPPASTAKTVTSLYALEHLGAGYRFPTRLLATGQLAGGQVQGDLILAGGGDPTLTTDDLGDMAAALRAAGVRGVTGRFCVWGGALPFVQAIDPGQPDYFGYNPSVSGLNLNFNRVNFEWKRGGAGYQVGMDARGERFVPPVSMAEVRIADRDRPLFTYDGNGAREEWTVAKAALGKAGSRWLPVRRPEAYAGDVFRTLAAAQGVALGLPETLHAMPERAVQLVGRASENLPAVLREMMKFSTNMTAEAVGMAASDRLGIREHAASGRAMTAWLKGRLAGADAHFVDHSGLGPASRIAPTDMVAALRLLGPQAGLRGLMKPLRVKLGADPRGPAEVLVDAKTGTLNFVSSLVGYMTAPDGTEMVFAIFTGDVARRDAIPEADRERPAGGEAWIRRSKRLQQQLIGRWVTVYGT